MSIAREPLCLTPHESYIKLVLPSSNLGRNAQQVTVTKEVTVKEAVMYTLYSFFAIYLGPLYDGILVTEI